MEIWSLHRGKPAPSPTSTASSPRRSSGRAPLIHHNNYSRVQLSLTTRFIQHQIMIRSYRNSLLYSLFSELMVNLCYDIFTITIASILEHLQYFYITCAIFTYLLSLLYVTMPYILWYFTIIFVLATKESTQALLLLSYTDYYHFA